MTPDHKAIAEAYNAGINHTTRNIDSYTYSPREDSSVRSENEERADVLKKRIALELNNMSKRAARGLKEDYEYIMVNMNTLHKDIASVFDKV